MNQNKRNRGFTLLEMLLVIAIIAILAGIVIVAINPARQLGQANNAQRQSDVLAILNAVHQYSIDESGGIPNTIPTLGDNETCLDDGADLGPICKYEGTSCAVDLDILVGGGGGASYLTDIPVDPLANSTEASALGFSADETGYVIVKETSGRVTVCAPLAENGEVIKVTR
jgi:prepilin-type N-terminal cleavage/methylation domain-containing protein